MAAVLPGLSVARPALAGATVLSARAVPALAFSRVPARNLSVEAEKKQSVGKKELVDLIAEECGYNKSDVKTVFEATLSTIVAQVAAGKRVSMTGFGSYEKKLRKGRVGRNPATGAEMQIPDKLYPAFSAGKNFKDTVAASPPLPKEK